jgi:hypothetical protein
MELKPYKKLTGLEQDLSKTVQYTEEFASQLTSLIFLKGNLIEATVTTSPTAINHGLQQVPQGWIIFDTSANATIWRAGWSDKTLTLIASASTNVKVWVF